jgi:hypothetical protein
VLGIVGIAGLARCIARAFGGHRLAHDDRARRAQHRDDRRVAIGRAAGVKRGAVFGRHVRGIHDVFHAHRHAVQRTQRPAFAPMLVERARLSECVLGIDKGPGLDVAVGFAHARETRRHELFRADRTIAYRVRRIDGGKPAQP